MERDVGRPPGARGEGGNLEVAGLGWSSLDSEKVRWEVKNVAAGWCRWKARMWWRKRVTRVR